jgi:hypothetical protein
MSLSTSNVTPTNIPLTPMRVTFNGVDLGGTTDHVSVHVKYDLADVMVDQYGKTPLDKRVSGQVFTVKLTLAEVKNKDNWKVAFASMSEVLTGSKLIYSNLQIGDSLLAKSAVLVLHPLEAAPGDFTNDYTFYKAAAMEVSDVKYGPDKQAGLSVEFAIFPDTATSPPRLMIYGDSTIGLISASAANPLAGSNTGNGTISSVLVYNGVTKTETITIKCVGSTSGNDFYVSGSTSGALGEIHVSAASGSQANFVAQTGSPGVITFTINQAGTQFVTNDSFTIATVASNYV